MDGWNMIREGKIERASIVAKKKEASFRVERILEELNQVPKEWQEQLLIDLIFFLEQEISSFEDEKE